jgi:predicted PurR-regulated permease PerM
MRAILRVVVIVVVSALTLYVLYLVREPLGYLVLACFIAVTASGPVNVLSRRMKRGFAVTLVYLGIIGAPIIIGAILIPPAVRQGAEFVDNLPEYVADINRAFEENESLAKLNENFDLTAKLDQLADDLASHLGDAAGALADLGAGIVNSLFALVTILVLSMFMVGRGRRWVDAFLGTRPPRQAASLRRALDGMATAVGAYVGGALAQALVAGIAAFLMLTILGVNSPLALAVIVAVLDIIPLVGATIGAVVVGFFTLFADFPLDTIIWAIFAIAYQQFENYVVQPRIQSRAVALDPFLVVVAALFGGALLGIIGAILAIPVAATIQVGVREFRDYRREAASPGPGAPVPPAVAGGPPADAPG